MCVGVKGSVGDKSNVIVANPEDGTVKAYTYNFKDRTCEPSCGDKGSELNNLVDRQATAYRFSEGLGAAYQAGSTINTFLQLGNQYKWWKGIDDMKWYDKWFEDNVLIRQIRQPERIICEAETDYSDLLDEGFMPTMGGQWGADIQAERYSVTEMNMTNQNNITNYTYYRYKVTYNVNGYVIFKPWPKDLEGKPFEDREVKFVVYLDDYNITGVLELNNRDSYFLGTSSSGVPLVIKSDKYFSKACIQFSNTKDIDPEVKTYLDKNGNSVCNTVASAVVTPPYINPLLYMPTGEEETAPSSGGGASNATGGGASGPSPGGQITI
jgi:hypothetical protein